MAAPVVPVEQHAERSGERVARGGAPSSVRRLARLLPELVALVVCAVLWAQAAGLNTTADGPGPAFFPRVLLALLALALVGRLGQEWRAGSSGANGATEEAVEVPLDGAPDLPVSQRRLALVIALAVGYVAASVLLGWVLATLVFVVAFLHAAGARRLLVTVPVAITLTVGLGYLFGKVVYLSLPVGQGGFAEITLRFFEALGVY